MCEGHRLVWKAKRHTGPESTMSEQILKNENKVKLVTTDV
jgi:hypothetical protein